MSNYISFMPNPITDPLVENWEKIRDEFSHYLLSVTLNNKPNYTTITFNDLLYRGNFTCMSLYLKDTLVDGFEAKSMNWQKWQQPGGDKFKVMQDHLNAMPTIKSWFEANREYIGGITYNNCKPGTKLSHHWGLDPNYIRLHLTLQEADGCVFDIENERRQWKDGELFGFDDCNVLHGTKHTGSSDRLIVLIDVKKEILKPFAKNWPCREFIPRSNRVVPVIVDW